MSNLKITTTQNVQLDYKIVDVAQRILAFLIDLCVFYLYWTLLFSLIPGLGTVIEGNKPSTWVLSLLVLPIMFYSLVLHVLFDGRTLGKMVMRTRVVRVDGSPVAWHHFLLRWVMRLVDIWTFFGTVGVLAILFSDKRQRIGDVVAGTVVISTRQKVSVSHTILEEVEAHYEPIFFNVTVLTDKDVRLIKETYKVAKNNNDFETLKMLRARVETILGVHSGLNDQQFIDTILKDYYFYTQQM